jgi:hypothetical protein
MPTIANRSPYWVSVKNRPDLARRFPFTKRTEARTYLRLVLATRVRRVLAPRLDVTERRKCDNGCS